MGKQIDQKVVEMRFDNAQFEKGVDQSVNSINKLKSSLEFSDTNAQLSGLQSSLSKLEAAFSPLGVAWRTVWGNIVSTVQSAVGKVMNEVNSMSVVGQFEAGFQKYTDMTKSVQTIMAATRQDWDDQGAQMDYVSDRLEKLNWYTDETSWAFVDMTSNIGKFTSAGIDLDTAVTAMQGIGNWAGISGAGVNEMSRAMYNLSQAMSMGGVQLRDWMSIENANMATKEFKQTAIETAVALGTLEEVEEGVWKTVETGDEVTIENFRTTLNSNFGNWFNSDVLLGTLNKYGSFNEQLYSSVQETGLTATELLGYLEDYKDETSKLTNLANEFEIVDTAGNISISKTKTLVEQYKKGMLDLDATAAEYGVTVDELKEKMSVFNGSFMDFNKISAETGVDTVTLINELAKLSDEEYELGLAAFKASQESKTLEDSLNATKDAVSSAWMNIWTAILGDYLEAKDLWTAVTEELWDIFVAGPVNMVRLINEWGDEMDGRALLFEGIANIWNGIKEAIGLIKEGMEEFFPPTTAEKLYEITEAFHEFSKQFILVDYAWRDEKGALKEIGTFIGNTVRNIWDSITSVAGAIKDAWLEIFPPKDSDSYTIIDKIHSVTSSINDFFEKIKMTDSRTDKLKRTFKGLFAVVDILRSILVAILNPIMGINTETGEMGDGILDVTSAIGDWLVKVRDWLSENKVFETVVQKVVDFISQIPGKVNELSVALSGMNFGELLSTIWERITKVAEGVKEFFGSLKSNEGTSEKTGGFFEKIAGHLETLREGWAELQPYVQQFFQSLKDNTEFKMPSFSEFTDNTKNLSVAAIFVAIAAAVIKFVNAINSLRKDKKKIVKSIKGMFDSIGGAADALKKNIQVNTFKTIATAILEIAAALFIMALIPQDKLNTVVTDLVVLLGEVAGIFYIISNTKASDKKLNQFKKAVMALELVLATLIGGIYLIATQTDINAAYAATIMMFVLIAEVGGLLAALSKIKFTEKQAKYLSKVMNEVCIMLLAMGVSLMIATSAGNWKAIGAAGAVMFLMLLAVFAFIAELDNIKITKAKADNLAAILKEICKVLVAMGVALMLATVTGASWKQIAAAGAAMAAMMIATAFALKIMPGRKTVQNAAEAMSIASIAFVLMGAALAIATSTGADFRTLIATGLAMGIMMVALAAAFKIMPSKSKVVESAAALSIAAAGILILAIAMKQLSGMSLKEVGITLLALLGALVLVLGAAYLAQYVVVGLEALGIAMALIGASALMAGAGMLMFATAMEKLFSLDPAGVQVMLDAVGGFFAMFPDIMTQIGEGILAFLQVFINGRQTIYEMFVGTFVLILTAYLTVMPLVVEAVTETIVQIVQAYRRVMPLVVAAIGETIIAIINMLREILPEFMVFLTELFYAITAFVIETAPTFVDTVFFVLQLLFDKLIEFTHANLPKLVDLVTFVIRELVRSIVETTSEIVAGLFAMLIDILTQLKDNIGPITALATEIAIEVILGFIQGITDEIPNIIDTGAEFVIGLINGIADGMDKHAQEMKEAMENLARSLLNAFLIFLGMDPEQANSVSTKFMDAGKNLIQGLIDGITGMGEAVGNAISDIANTLIDTFKKDTDEHSPSKLFAKFGGFIDEGLANGLRDNVSMVADATDEVAGESINGMSKAIAAVSDLLNEDMDAEPTIRPVLDLSNVTDGVSEMDSMLAEQRAVDLASYNSMAMNSSLSSPNDFSTMLQNLKDVLSGNNQNGIVQNNTFNINGAEDPTVVADKVSAVLQNQVERRNAVWV